MEKESFLSGYCRVQDHSRVVCLVTEDGCLTEVDCGYPGCIYCPNCPIAAQMDDFLGKND